MGNKAAFALFGMSGFLLLFATYVSLLPDLIESRAQVEIDYPKQNLTNYLSRVGDWEEWLFTEKIKNTEGWRTVKAGEAFGEGGVLKWFSESIGDGALEIKKIDSLKIIFERISDDNSFSDRCYLFLEETENGTKIKMIDSLDLSANFFARYEAQDESYIKEINSSNFAVLERLKSIVESKK